MKRRVIFPPDDYWTQENTTVTDVCNLTNYIKPELNDEDGLRVAALTVDGGGIGVLLVLHTDLGNFAIGLGRSDVENLYGSIQTLVTSDPKKVHELLDTLTRPTPRRRRHDRAHGTE